MADYDNKTKLRQKTIVLPERIDTDNTDDIKRRITEELDAGDFDVPVFDARDLGYISSTGLRMILNIRKSYPGLRMINVCPDVYGILDMTGFTQLMTVDRAYRTISVEGCDIVGSGANGTLYRIDRDNVVKVYDRNEDIADILHEREVAKLALVLGVPTAISYEVVKVGDCYGSVFELLDAISFSSILASDPSKLDWCVDESVKLLKKIHGIRVEPGKLPDIRDRVLSRIDGLSETLPEEACDKLRALVRAVPADDHMIHGDFHTNNLMLHDDEVLLIDMETLSTGHPVFDLATMFCACVGFSEVDHGHVMKFLGYDYDTSVTLWKKSLAKYLGTGDGRVIKDVEEKACVIGYVRMIHYFVRHGMAGDGVRAASVAHWKERLLTLLEHTKTLAFDTGESGSQKISGRFNP